MSHHSTVFHRPSDSRLDTGFGLPPDLVRQSRGRVRLVGWVVLLGAGVDLFFMLLDLAFHPASAVTALADLPTALPFYANTLSVLAAIAVIAAASTERIRGRRLLGLALGFEVFLGFVISVSNPLSFYGTHRALPNLTWVTPLIILFPMIVPCPPRRTLVTAILTAAMRPLGLVLLVATGQVSAEAGDYFASAFSPALAVVIATMGSRVIYRLGVEVAEARRMGSYDLERLLGQGGMGEVWLAKHRLLARPAAVKLVRPELVGARDGDRVTALQRFEREAQATASMRSPHTIELYDFGIATDGTFYYVMELLDGFDADTLVRRFGAAPAGRVVHLLHQVCHSLAEAHEAGLIHRDVKPANLYVCRYGRDLDFVKVLDFGLVRKSGDTDAALTGEQVVTGTPAFMAPEQVTGRTPTDARSDLYAVGCVGYWLLAGQHVFGGATAMQVMMHHADTAPEPPSRRTDASIPEALERVVMRCLEKDPARRPQSAQELADLLSGCGVAPWSSAEAKEWWARHAPEAAKA